MVYLYYFANPKTIFLLITLYFFLKNMNLEKLIAVAGTNAGVYAVVNSRNDGLVIQDLITKKNTFIPSRGNQFTPMQTISVYDTENDTKPLADIFTDMKAALDTLPLPSVKDSDAALREYFTQIMPTHDRSRVYISDIKKVIKWFGKLNESGFFEQAEADSAQLAEENSTQLADSAA